MAKRPSFPDCMVDADVRNPVGSPTPLDSHWTGYKRMVVAERMNGYCFVNVQSRIHKKPERCTFTIRLC